MELRVPLQMLTIVSVLLASISWSAHAQSARADGVQLGVDLEVQPLRAGFWLATSKNAQGIPANALIARIDGGLLLVDTPWTEAQTERLLAYAQRLGKVVDAVVTHSHADRMGGIAALRRTGIRVRAVDLTVAKARGAPEGAPETLFEASAGRYRDDRGFEVIYPGPGHTTDNVVVWFPKADLLFGGCLVRAHNARELGNVAEADIKAWLRRVRALEKRYPSHVVIVPGHGPVGEGALERTIALLRRATFQFRPPATAPVRRWLLDGSVALGLAYGGDDLGAQMAGEGVSGSLGIALTPLWVGRFGFGLGAEIGFKYAGTLAGDGTSVSLRRFPLVVAARAMVTLAEHWQLLLAGGPQWDLALRYSYTGRGPLPDGYEDLDDGAGWMGELGAMYVAGRLGAAFRARYTRMSYHVDMRGITLEVGETGASSFTALLSVHYLL